VVCARHTLLDEWGAAADAVDADLTQFLPTSLGEIEVLQS
jgi:hypothetical protein